METLARDLPQFSPHMYNVHAHSKLVRIFTANSGWALIEYTLMEANFLSALVYCIHAHTLHTDTQILYTGWLLKENNTQ